MSTPEALLARCEQIRTKLKRLDELDSDRWFDGHLGLEPPLEEAEIAAFEAKNSIKLPLDYRAFLLHVGGSGTGPYYGLEPLGCFQHATFVVAPKAEFPNQLIPEDFLRTPFPHHDWWQPLEYESRPEDETRKQYEEWQEEMGKRREQHLYPIQFVAGTLTMAHYGCGVFDFLVVSGDERGNMWRDDRINAELLYPVTLEEPLQDDNFEEYVHVTYEEGKRISFLDWYEGWLDNALYFAENHLDDMEFDEELSDDE